MGVLKILKSSFVCVSLRVHNVREKKENGITRRNALWLKKEKDYTEREGKSEKCWLAWLQMQCAITVLTEVIFTLASSGDKFTYFCLLALDIPSYFTYCFWNSQLGGFTVGVNLFWFFFFNLKYLVQVIIF